MSRSTSYPCIDLGQALIKLSALADLDSETPAEVVERLGYAPKSGLGNRVLSALRQYGLLRSAKGSVALTATARALLESSSDSSTYRAALRCAAQRPKIHGEVLDAVGPVGPLPDHLHELFEERGLNPTASHRAAEIFAATVKLAALFEPVSTTTSIPSSSPHPAIEVHAKSEEAATGSRRAFELATNLTAQQKAYTLFVVPADLTDTDRKLLADGLRFQANRLNLLLTEPPSAPSESAKPTAVVADFPQKRTSS